MQKTSFVKDSREVIRNNREMALDEIRKDHADQKEKEIAKDFAESQKRWNKAFTMGLAGLAAVFTSAFVVANLPLSSATAVIAGLFSSYLIVGGSVVFYSNISSCDADKLTDKGAKEMKIEEKNRSESREVIRREIRRLKEIESSANQKEGESIRRCINEKANILIKSSPARRELANRLRPGLVERFHREKE